MKEVAAARPMETVPSESGQVESLRLKKPCGLLLVDLEQLDLKRQLGVRRNRIAGAPCVVPEFRRDDKLPLAADLHAGHAFVPAFDDPARAQGERERPAAILAAVEFRPVLEPTGVVHLDRVAGLGLVAVADLQLFIIQAGFGRNHARLLWLECYLISNTSTSNVSSAFGGMGGLPRSPYASSAGMMSLRLPPAFMPQSP